jgi:hypothetical protein
MCFHACLSFLLIENKVVSLPHSVRAISLISKNSNWSPSLMSL